MPIIERLPSEAYRRLPWKNGRGELVLIDGEGGDSWQNTGVAWHFGRTAINEEGPFSDYTGYERLQVVIKGAGLVLIAPGHEVDLRRRMHPRRYDGGTPIRTRLENGPVEVVNLIADRLRFNIDLCVGTPSSELSLGPGRHVIYAPDGAGNLTVDDQTFALEEDCALRVHADARMDINVRHGEVLVASIYRKL